MNREQSVLDNFVVLEGLDGSGTSTQLQLLDRRLGGAGIPHSSTCEPTDGVVGRLIREVLEGRRTLHAETVAPVSYTHLRAHET